MITKYNDTDLQNLLSFIPGLTGRTVVSRENLYYSGAVAGTEFLTYAVTKMYLCKQLIVGRIPGGTIVGNGNVSIYDAADVLVNNFSRRLFIYNGVDPICYYDSFVIDYLLFSRITANQYTNITFSGMRITLSP